MSAARRYRLQRVQTIPRPVDEVFAFFADARNLEAITPAFLQFRITTPGAIELRPGAVIDYQLRLFGIRFTWQTQIETFEPGKRFTDVQLRGPYRYWHHQHEFTADGQVTQMVDQVDYELPLGPLGSLAHVLFVRRTLERIFDYRRDCIERLLANQRTSLP
jgi:ligand-binding SRPBCC domain-containing protein